jgi:nucleoside-diphosphate-sugar epimerase
LKIVSAPTLACPPSEALPLIALTGASGFIGRHLVRELSHAGYRLRLLTRREPEVADWQGAAVQVVAGSLEDPDALARLVEGADVVVHLAGLIKAAKSSQFFAINQDASARLASIAKKSSADARFFLISSLAAREPHLSDYAASKRGAEDSVLATLGDRATVLRPPAVYGPGDPETLLFFKLAQLRRIPLLGGEDARIAMIHVQDLSRLIVGVLQSGPCGQVMSAADDRPEGYRWSELLRSAAIAVGNETPRFMRVPKPLLSSVALLGDVARALGSASMLNSQKLRELRHPDWSVSQAERAQPTGWTARFDLNAGFADAVRWYRRAGRLAEPD